MALQVLNRMNSIKIGLVAGSGESLIAVLNKWSENSTTSTAGFSIYFFLETQPYCKALQRDIVGYSGSIRFLTLRK